MTVAEAAAQTVYIVEQEADERLWEVWLNDRTIQGFRSSFGDKAKPVTFEQFRAETRANAQKAQTKPAVRALREGEEAARLDFAAQFVKFDGRGVANV